MLLPIKAHSLPPPCCPRRHHSYSRSTPLNISALRPITFCTAGRRRATMASPAVALPRKRCSVSDVAPIEAVLFDIDGTLCDSDPIHFQAFLEMLPKIGFNDGVPITEMFFVENFSGKHNDDIARQLFPDDFDRGVKFMEEKESLFRRLASQQLKPISGLDKVRKWIEDRGLKRAAVTNAPRINAELMISILGLNDFFEALIVGSECERAKPHPDPYLKGLEAVKASKDHTLIFEDSFSGITAGVAAGMPVVGLLTRNPEEELLKASPALLIKDYADPELWKALQQLVVNNGGADTVEV